MSTELDVSWFDLKKYDALAKLDLGGWYTQIKVREKIFHLIASGKEENVFNALKIIKKLQENPIWTSLDDAEKEWSVYQNDSKFKYPFNTHSVYSTPALYMWFNVSTEQLQNIWECCINVIDEGTGDELQEDLINTPYDLLIQQAGIEEGERFTNVVIDLTATDEQILGDFKYWLSKYRKETGYKSSKNNFGDKNLVEWQKYRVLPYFDLNLFSPVMKCLQDFEEGIEDIDGVAVKTIYETKIARLIFPDKDDPVGALRTTKKKFESLLKDETIKAIEIQLYSFKGN